MPASLQRSNVNLAAVDPAQATGSVSAIIAQTLQFFLSEVDEATTVLWARQFVDFYGSRVSVNELEQIVKKGVNGSYPSPQGRFTYQHLVTWTNKFIEERAAKERYQNKSGELSVPAKMDALGKAAAKSEHGQKVIENLKKVTESIIERDREEMKKKRKREREQKTATLETEIRLLIDSLPEMDEEALNKLKTNLEMNIRYDGEGNETSNPYKSVIKSINQIL